VVSVAQQPALARARAALDRGDGAEAATIVERALASSSLTRDDELSWRVALAEAWLLRDDFAKAGSALGRQPDPLRETLPPALLSALWRLHGRIAFARGDQSKAIALHGRALKQAEIAHDAHAIGLAHYELGLCYKQVGDSAIVREHINKAAPALHAAGDRRYLALLHSLSGVSLAQSGRPDEAGAALRQAERLASAVNAADVVGTVCNNQAIVALIQHRYEQALALAERSVSLHKGMGSGRGLAISMATLGQIAVRMGELDRAEQILNHALDVRTPVQYHEITGAVFDSLAQIHLMRGAYGAAGECLRRAGESYGGYGRQTSLWYEWSIRVLEAKLALRRGAYDEALRLSEEIAVPLGNHKTEGLEAAFEPGGAAPPGEALQGSLISCEALLALGRTIDAEARLSSVRDRLDPGAMPSTWGEFLRVRGQTHAANGRIADAYHDLAQSVNVFELLAERYQGGLSHLAIGRLSASAGSPAMAEQHLQLAEDMFAALGAVRDLDEVQAARARLHSSSSSPVDLRVLAAADDAVIQRLVDASAMPELLARETAAAIAEATDALAVVLFVRPAAGEPRLLAAARCDARAGLSLANAIDPHHPGPEATIEAIGQESDGPRFCLVQQRHPLGDAALRRIRMIAAVARQGFDLCAARQRPAPVPEGALGRSLEPLLPGFLCASEAMALVAEQIRRLRGNDLPVLITGESGTGKELVARAIHAGSLRSGRTFLPYNCTTTTRDLADSQLFGHRRGSFTGAVADQLGVIRAAAGGTLFLDEIGDLPLDVQPKLLRFLEQGEVMAIGEAKPQRVDVRVLAATNADLEQRVAEGRFREDLYYRLSVIRLHLPPLRERREEIPHLASLFVREACERLAQPDIRLSAATLEILVQYYWPGNVRQLRNEVQRAVTMSSVNGVVEPQHLSPELAASQHHARPTVTMVRRVGQIGPQTLASAVEQVERDLIHTTLERAAGNISEAARALGLTRRGLYLKLRRLGFEGRAALDSQ
jgi:DNA-binding NtrC family response regulator/tetratricopeptide (TPR) repeat protein